MRLRSAILMLVFGTLMVAALVPVAAVFAIVAAVVLMAFVPPELHVARAENLSFSQRWNLHFVTPAPSRGSPRSISSR